MVFRVMCLKHDQYNFAIKSLEQRVFLDRRPLKECRLAMNGLNMRYHQYLSKKSNSVMFVLKIT